MARTAFKAAAMALTFFAQLALGQPGNATHQTAASSAAASWEALVEEGEELYRQKQIRKATKRLRDAVHRAEQFGERDPRLAKSLFRLAVALYSRGDDRAAPVLPLRNILPAAFIFSSGHFKVGQLVLHGTATEEGARRFYAPPEEAIKLLERAVAICEKAPGAQKGPLTELLEELGAANFALGRMEEARSYYERTLASRENLLGPEHPHLAGDLYMLALTHREQGRLAEAEPFLLRALGLLQRTGRADPAVVAALGFSLAVLYTSQSKYALAEPLVADCVRGYENNRGMADLLYDAHAHVLEKLGREAEAKQQRNRAKEIRKAASRP